MLLTNWLANVTSRLRKRPVFRSRDRRAIRQRWQTATQNQITTAEVLEDRTLLTTFFVDDDFTSGSDFSGTDTDPGTGGDQNAVWNVTAFATIQAAINAAAATGDTIQVAAGTYSGLISLNKSVDLLGANAGIDPNTMARGAESIIDHDGFYAIQPTADDATIDGFSFEGNGGRVIDSYAGADNLTIANNIFNNTNIPGGQGGIQLQSGSFDDLTVEQNLFQFTGDGDALLVGGGGSFERMHIVGNHFAGTTGGIFQNGGTINDAVVEQNEFTGGVGMNMGDAGNIQIRENTFDGTFYTGFQVGTIDGEIVGNTFQNIEAYPGFFGQAFELWGGQYGTTVSQNVTIENNVIHYNDVAGAAEPTHGIRLRTPDAGSGIDASTIHINNNAFIDGGVRGDAKAIRHFGDQTTAVDASENWWGTTSESSIEALMEDADGGTPVMVDFTSFLNDGADTNVGLAGFQGDYSVLNVTALGAQTGAPERINEAIQAVNSGGTVYVNSGIYNESVVVDRGITLGGTPDIQGTVKVTDNASLAPGFSAGIMQTQDLILGGAFELDSINLGSFTQLDVGPGEDLRYVESVQGQNILFWRNSSGDLSRATYTWDGTNLVLGAITTATGLTSGDHASILNVGGGVLEGYFHSGAGPSTAGQYHAISNDGGQTWINETFISYPFPTAGLSDSGTTGGGGIIEVNGERRIYAQNNFGDIVMWTGPAGANGPLTNAGVVIDGSTGNFQNQSPSGDAILLPSGETLYLYVDGEGSESSLGAIGALILDQTGLGITSQIDNFISVTDIALSGAGLTRLDEMTIGDLQLSGNTLTGVLMIAGDSVTNGNNEDLFYAPITINLAPAAPAVPAGLDIEIDGNAAGTGYDQIDVTGTVSIGDGVSLNLIDGYDPLEGDQFVIINNDGTDPVNGTFVGLPEGHEFVDFLGVVGQNAYLTYAGGDGNDVVIVVEDSTPEVTVPVNGTSDDYTLEVIGSNLVLSDSVSGNVISVLPVNSLEGPLVINGEDNQDDTLTIDLTNIDHTTDIQIQFEGGAGGNDTLRIDRTGGINSVEHVFVSSSDGSIFLDGEATATITYTGLEPVIDNLVANDRIFSFTGAAETITLSDDINPADNVSQIDSDLFGEVVTFLNPTNNIIINTEVSGGSGADTVDIDGIDANFDANVTVNAGTDDTINTGTVDIASGALDLTAGQVNVNGAFTTTGTVDILATAADITFDAAGSIDAGTSEIDLTAFFNVESLIVTTDSEVRVTASGGGINDFTGNALITADRVALVAGGAGGITGIETNVNTLAASAAGGAFTIDNVGDLVIGSVNGLDGITANSSNIFVTTTGALTINQAVSADTVGYLRAIDAAGTGQDLNINAGVTSTSGNLNLQAGDNLNLATGITLDSAAALILNIDSPFGGTPDATGGVANLNGILIAGTDITVNGGTEGDQVIIDGNGGALNDGGTVDGISGLFTFYGNAGADELIVDDSGDNTGDNILIQNTGVGVGSVIGAGAVSLSYDALEDLTVYSGTDADDITVNPNVLTTIDIVGGNPAAPAFPGDSLTYLTPPGESSTFTPDGLDGGTISATGPFQDVTFDEIEGLTFGGSIVVDGTAGDDTLTITALTANSGTYQINGGPIINFNANTDFTFNGLAGDDTLIINNPAGGLFDPVNGINFNGGTGGETLGDTLQILGGTAAIVEHQFVDNNNGSVFYNGEGTATITYTGLEPIDDTITATDRIFTFTGAAETITLSDDGGPGDGLSLIDSDLGESVNFIHPIATLTINTELSGGSGADIINIDPLDSTFTANLTVNAGTDDIINTGTVDIGAGALDLTSGQVFVNGAFTTTGSVDVDSTFGDITFAAAGSIDAGASEIDLTAFFNVESLNVTTTSEVRVTATGGGINDLTGNALITADRAALRVGGPGGITGIDTNVNTLATSVASGAFTIDNTGNLEIGTVDGLSGITAAASQIFLTTTGTLLVSDTVTGGAVDLRSNGTMTISDNVSASTGTLKLQNNANDFILNNLAQISNSGAFLIDIFSVGTVDLADGSEITSSGTGLIDIFAVNNINLSNVNTGGEVQLFTTLGSITDNTAGEAALIDADTVSLQAHFGIGAAGAADIDLAINTMAANEHNGDIFIQEPSAATIGTVNGLDGITAAGNISLSIGGTLNINQKIEATGAASIIQANVQGDINVNSTVQTNGGGINLYADDNLALGATSLVDTTTAELVRLFADFNNDSSGGFTQDEGSLVNARGGDLVARAYGDVEIADLQSAGGRVVVISVGGGVVDNTTSPSEAPLI
ncbi:hypothetical protein, partial [Gimesia chilikensis]|uniref:hypothetical protein n=1 Tax=Gimesia chilikensis TaxID=2605989 RepID=UPI0018D79637